MRLTCGRKLALTNIMVSQRLSCSIDAVEAAFQTAHRGHKMIDSASTPSEQHPEGTLVSEAGGLDGDVLDSISGPCNAVSRKGPQVLEGSVSLSLTRNQCVAACTCQCHSRNSFKSPKFLNSIFGTLFVGYCANPWLRQACNVTTCRNTARRTSLTYIFPRWLLSQTIQALFVHHDQAGPEMVVRMVNTRPKLFLTKFMSRVIDDGNLDVRAWLTSRVKRALICKEMTARDVNPEGMSDLHVWRSYF